MRKITAAAAAIVIWTGLAGAADDAQFRARLATVPIDSSNADEVTGIGEAHAELDGDQLIVSGTFEGLQGTATAAKLHHSSFVGVRGDAIADLEVTAAREGAISGTVTLTREQIDALESGRLYVQIDSEAAPEGNLFGWLMM